MKIIKYPPKPVQVKAKCDRCGCCFIAEKGEFRPPNIFERVFMLYDDYVAKCPFCGHRCECYEYILRDGFNEFDEDGHVDI